MGTRYYGHGKPVDGSDRIKKGKGGENYPPPNVGFLGTDLCLFERDSNLFKLGNGVVTALNRVKYLGMEISPFYKQNSTGGVYIELSVNVHGGKLVCALPYKSTM